MRLLKFISILILLFLTDAVYSQSGMLQIFDRVNRTDKDDYPEYINKLNSEFSPDLGCGTTFKGKLIPEDYDNFPIVPAGSWWIEKPFNTKIIRITDTGEKNNTLAEHRYSSVCAFNHTGDYFICTHKPADVWLHDGRNGVPIRQLKLYHTCCVWSMEDENILYYCYTNQLRSYNVLTDEETIVRTFQDESELDFGGNEGDISNDGRYICFSSTSRTRWFVYDLFDDIKYDVLEVSDPLLIDAAQISPSGKYVVIEYAFKAANDYQEGVGCCVHDSKTMQFIRNIYYLKTQHNDVGFDDDGDEAMFIPDVHGDFSGAGPSAILSIKLQTGEKKVIHQFDETTWLAFHFSQRCCMNRHDYVFSGAYNKSNIDPNSSGWKPYWNEILAIPLDTTKETVRLCHHYGNGMSPRPSVNRQGDRIIFDSNLFGSTDWSDVFMIMLEPPDTIPPLLAENLRIGLNSNNQVTLEWDAPVAAIDGDLPRHYQVFRDSLLIGYTRNLNITDTTVVENTTYTYRIYSIDESAIRSVSCKSIDVTTGVDIDPPEIIKIVPLGLKALAIHFNEDLEKESALNIANYVIRDDIEVTRFLLACKKAVLIETTEQLEEKNYTISISGIRDASVNRNQILGTVSKSFIARKGSEISFQDFSDDFDVADTNQWQFRRPELWSHVEDQGRNVFGTNTSDFTYPGPGRIGAYALVKDRIFADFTMTCEARLKDSREFEFIWNYQDDFNYHYVMIHKLPQNNDLFLLVDSMRYSITPFTDFTQLDDNDYHRIQVQTKCGHFAVSFDDSVIVEGDDQTFMYGKVGMGSFGGWVYFDAFSIEVDREFMSKIEEKPNTILPQQFVLHQNYPNPFNCQTKISYELQEDQKVVFKIFNINGQVVKIIVDEKQNAGFHSIVWNAFNLPSDIYFYELKTGNFRDSKKMLLLK